ncbi:MAG: hypothetical protein INH41_30055 [Myxococcaceae bacterium]|nr:hypothetical protein [Myxococcaceae bacterium]MCA3016649.1 hypothetical protein [Myxococcaceae bacterium]
MTSRAGFCYERGGMSAPATTRLSIISPVQDFLFFFLSAAVVLVAWAATALLHVEPFYVLAAVAVVSNGPHLVATWSRVYFDKREVKERPVALLVMPAVIFVFVALTTWKAGYPGVRLLNSVILYWATWHFVAQNWGILRIYQRKSGEPETSLALSLERPLLLLFVLWCVLYRLHTGPRLLFGTEVFYALPSRDLVNSLLAIVLVVLGIFLAERFSQRRAPWARAARVRLAFLGCAFLGFFVPFQMITTDDTSAFAAAACWHGFQYLGMIRFYHRNTWRAGVDPDAKLISWLSQPGWTRAVLYVAFLGALAGSVYGVIFALSLVTRDSGWNFVTWGGVVWITLTLSHYWLDGVIWKLRRPELARRVGLEGPPQNTTPMPT